MEKKVLLKDLVSTGTHIRTEVTPKAVISDNGEYLIAEFWDANKTIDVIVNNSHKQHDNIRELDEFAHNTQTLLTEEIQRATNAEQELDNKKADKEYTYTKSEIDFVIENNVATLDANGKVKISLLPSYVDDVIEGYYHDNKFYKTKTLSPDTYSDEVTPEQDKLYINLENDKLYRWSGSAYIEVSSSDVTGIKIGASGSIISPSDGIITIPEYETGAQTHRAPTAAEVKTALGVGTGKSKFLREDGIWVDPPYYEEKTYGIQWTSSNATPTRIGNVAMHKTLPVQSGMKRCMVQDDGTVYGYIDPEDYTKYVDGRTVDYTGAHGQLLVEIPEYWYIGTVTQSENISTYTIEISPMYIAGYKYSPKCYVGAVEASTNDSSSDSVKKLFSICTADIVYDTNGDVNASDITSYSSNASDYLGGSRVSTYTGVKSLLGRPATSLTRSEFRTKAAARGTGWSLQYWKAYMAWVRLYVVEYCNFNAQATFNATKTAEGYMQGGLGAGATTISSSDWSNFNSRDPFVPCGVTKRLVNNTGIVNYKFAENEFTANAVTIQIPSYRGIENPFGHVFKWTDGVNIYCDDTIHKSSIYVCDDITKFADNTPTDYILRTSDCYQGTNGYIKDWLIDENADFLPLTTGGSANSYLYDLSYLNNAGWRVLRSGGDAYDGTYCGLFCFNAGDDSSRANARIGGRLYYTPTE